MLLYKHKKGVKQYHDFTEKPFYIHDVAQGLEFRSLLGSYHHTPNAMCMDLVETTLAMQSKAMNILGLGSIRICDKARVDSSSE
jgi:hypothetical protein